jgi:hypothetical protein
MWIIEMKYYVYVCILCIEIYVHIVHKKFMVHTCIYM